MDTVFQVTEFGSDRRLEYFMRDGTAWVRETYKKRTHEMILTTYLVQDPYDLALFFALGIDRLN